MSLYETIKNRLGADIPTREKELNQIRDIYFRKSSKFVLEPSHLAIRKLSENRNLPGYKRISSIIEILAREAIEYRENLDGADYLILAQSLVEDGQQLRTLVRTHREEEYFAFMPLLKEIGLRIEDLRPGPGSLIECSHKYHVQRALAIYNYANAVYAWNSGERERYEESLAKAIEAADRAYEAKKDDIQIITYRLLASKEGVPVVDMPFPLENSQIETAEADQELVNKLISAHEDPLSYEVYEKLRARNTFDLDLDLKCYSLKTILNIRNNYRWGAYRFRQAVNAYVEQIIEDLDNPGKSSQEISERMENFHDFLGYVNPASLSDRCLEERFENFSRLYFKLAASEDDRKDRLSNLAEIIKDTAKALQDRQLYTDQHRQKYMELLLNEGEYIQLVEEHKDALDKAFIKRMRQAAVEELSQIDITSQLLGKYFLCYFLNKDKQEFLYTRLSSLSSSQKQEIKATRKSLSMTNRVIAWSLKQLGLGIRLVEQQIAKERLPGHKHRKRQNFHEMIGYMENILSPIKEETIHFHKRINGRECHSPLEVYLPTIEEESHQLVYEMSLMPEILLKESEAIDDLDNMHKMIYKEMESRFREIQRLNDLLDSPSISRSQKKVLGPKKMNGVLKNLFKVFVLMHSKVEEAELERININSSDIYEEVYKLSRANLLTAEEAAEKLNSSKKEIENCFSLSKKGYVPKMSYAFLGETYFIANRNLENALKSYRNQLKRHSKKAEESNESEKEGKDKEAEPAAPEPEERQRKGILKRLADAASYMPRAVLEAMSRGAHQTVSEPAPDPESTAAHEVRESPDSPLPKIDHKDLKQATGEYKDKKKPKPAVPGGLDSPEAKKDAINRSISEAVEKERAKSPDTPKVFSLESVQRKGKKQPIEMPVPPPPASPTPAAGRVFKRSEKPPQPQPVTRKQIAERLRVSDADAKRILDISIILYPEVLENTARGYLIHDLETVKQVGKKLGAL